MSDFITLSKDEYDELMIDARERDNLLALLFGTAELDYFHDLRIGGSIIRDLLKVQYPNRYRNTLQRLEEQQTKNEA